MLVLRDGRIFGTIGGGCGEAEVCREALSALDSLSPTTYIVNMTNDMAEEEGMVCGGKMEVFIDILGEGINEDKKLMQSYISSLVNNEDPVLATVVDCSDLAGTSPGSKRFVSLSSKVTGDHGSSKIDRLTLELVNQIRSENKPRLITTSHADITLNDDSRLRLFIDPAPLKLKLLILGGGHISLPLSTMAKLLGYHVTVVDDRPFFANNSRFSTADRVVCNDFVQAIRQIDIDLNTCIVIVTRGHRHDKLCLKEILNYPNMYTGMIGSKRRVQSLLSELEEQEVPPEYLQKVHSPIGLNINAETPEEIAVSILAELINVHRGGTAQSLKLNNSNKFK